MATVYWSGASQSVRIPAAHRFPVGCTRVILRETAGSLVLTPMATSWDQICRGHFGFINGMVRAATGGKGR